MQPEHRTLIHDLIAERTGLPGRRIVWSYEGRVRPQVPFILLREYGDQKAAGRSVSRTDKPGVLSVRAPYECTLTVQYFGSGAEEPVDVLSDIVHWLECPSVVDRFFAAGMAVYDVGNVNDISTVLDSLAYEKRAAVDLSIRYDRTIEDDVGYIESVDIKENLDKCPERIIKVDVKGEYQ